MPDLNRDVFFSVVIPAHNEEECIADTIEAIVKEFFSQSIHDYELLVVNDNSTDGTEAVLQKLATSYSPVRYINNAAPHGFGFAVRRGLLSGRCCLHCHV
jgi:dolichol-phosphate mannosyltransferase